RRSDARAMIFDISRGKMKYCFVRPAEYSACILAAALREAWRGPVFIQGDHLQFPLKQDVNDTAKVTGEIKAEAREAIDAGFFNIDIAPSTLVVLTRPTL